MRTCDEILHWLHAVRNRVNGTALGYLSELCVSVASASGRQHLRSASMGLCCKFSEPEPRSAGGASLSRDHLRGTVFPRCSMETRDDSAHFQETTECLSVRHLMCWLTEGTFTTARRCCDVFVILAPDTKLQTYLLTYYGTSRIGQTAKGNGNRNKPFRREGIWLKRYSCTSLHCTEAGTYLLCQRHG